MVTYVIFAWIQTDDNHTQWVNLLLLRRIPTSICDHLAFRLIAASVQAHPILPWDVDEHQINAFNV